jgi:feruloyl esterase
MFSYVPPSLGPQPALVVVLHGCTQSAASYDHGVGWSTLADRHRFTLLFPEQQRANNANQCFNWFQEGDIARDRGEALSIRQMVERMAVDQGVDRQRIFITGLSAGGAMTSVMLATYPEIFAGGAIIAGLPYRSATNVQQAFESMFHSARRSARAWGDLVRQASTHRGPWPRISIWHGSADKTVVPGNARELIKQWTSVHGVSAGASDRQIISRNGAVREVWRNLAGDDVVECYEVPNMGHGTPISASGENGSCGKAGPFILDVGLSSSHHIAQFFGLAETPSHATVDMGEVSTKEDFEHEQSLGLIAQGSEEKSRERDRRSDSAGIEGVITRALTAAGLIKTR